MQAEVRRINRQGKLLRKSEWSKAPPCRGTLQVFENRLHSFGRVVMCATLKSRTDGTETLLLPELLDVELIWLSGKTLRLRGIEQIDGVLFGQTWDVEVVA